MKFEVYSLNKVLKVVERRPGCNLLSIRDSYTGHEDTDEKKVVIAMPVDRLAFNGTILVASFMEIDMDNFLDKLSLRSSNNNTTFCNIYTRNGKALTNLVLGGLSADDAFSRLEDKANARYDRASAEAELNHAVPRDELDELASKYDEF